MKKSRLALLCCLAASSVNAIACFTVYDPANRVVYNAQTPPVDMSYQIHETLPRVFPGGHMVFGNSQDCPRFQAGWVNRADAVAHLGESQRASLLPSVGTGSDMVITELRDPAVTLYGRMHDGAR